MSSGLENSQDQHINSNISMELTFVVGSGFEPQTTPSQGSD